MSGGLYKLTPDQIHAEMRKDGTGAIMEDGVMYVTVVMTPDPNWQKIGRLEQVR